MSRHKNEIRRFIALELRVKRQVIPFVFDFGTVDDRFFGIERRGRGRAIEEHNLLTFVDYCWRWAWGSAPSAAGPVSLFFFLHLFDVWSG